MVSSGLIYKLEKLADEAILSEAFAIIPLWKFRAETPPGFWNSKLHLITSPCLQNSNQEPPPLLYCIVESWESQVTRKHEEQTNRMSRLAVCLCIKFCLSFWSLRILVSC